MENLKYLVLKNNNDTELNETGDLKANSDDCMKSSENEPMADDEPENETMADDEPDCLLSRNAAAQKRRNPKAAVNSQLKIKFNFKRSKVSQNQRKIKQGNKKQSINTSSVMSKVLQKTKKLTLKQVMNKPISTMPNIETTVKKNIPKELAQSNPKKVYPKGTNVTETKPVKIQSRNILTGNNTPEKNWAISSESPTILKIKRVQSPESSSMKPDGSHPKKPKPTSFNCLFCHDVFPELHELDQHCRDIHLSSIRKEYFKKKPAVHSCRICGEKFGFLFKKAFDQHVATHNGRVDPPASDLDCRNDGGEEHRNSIDKKSKTNVDFESSESDNRFDELPLVCEGPIKIPRATLMSLPCVAADMPSSDDFLADSSQMDYQGVPSSTTATHSSRAGVKLDLNFNSVAHTPSSVLSLTTPMHSHLTAEVCPPESCYPSPIVLFPNFVSDTTPVKFNSTPKKIDKIFTPAKANLTGEKIFAGHMIDKIPLKPHFTPEKVGERPPRTLLSDVVGQHTPVKTNITTRKVGKKCSWVAIPMISLTPAKVSKTFPTFCPDIVNEKRPAKVGNKSPPIPSPDILNDKTPRKNNSNPKKIENNCPLPAELFALNSTPEKIDKSKNDPISTEASALQPTTVATPDQKETKIYNSQVNPPKNVSSVKLLENTVASSAKPDQIGLANPQTYPIPGLTFSKFFVWHHSAVSVCIDKPNYQESGEVVKMARLDVNKDFNIKFASDSNFKAQDSNSGLQDKSTSSRTLKNDSASEEDNSANNSPVEKRNRNESINSSGDKSSCITEDKSTSAQEICTSKGIRFPEPEHRNARPDTRQFLDLAIDAGMPRAPEYYSSSSGDSLPDYNVIEMEADQERINCNTTVSRYVPEEQSKKISAPGDKCVTLQTSCIYNIEIDTTEASSTSAEKSCNGKCSYTTEDNNASNGEISTSENESSANKISCFSEDNSVIESSSAEENERDSYTPEGKCPTTQASFTSVDKSPLNVVQSRPPITTASSIPEFESAIPEDRNVTIQLNCIPEVESVAIDTNCTQDYESSVNGVTCTLKEKSNAIATNCIVANKSTANEATCTSEFKNAVFEAIFTLVNKNTARKTNSIPGIKSTTELTRFTSEDKTPANEASCTLQNKSTASSTLNAKSTLKEASYTPDKKSSTVEVSCASQERSVTNLSSCVTEDIQSSHDICTTEDKSAIVQGSCISEVKNSTDHISIPEENCVINLHSKCTSELESSVHEASYTREDETAVIGATCFLQDDSTDKEAPEYKSVVYEAIFALVNNSISKKTNDREWNKITTTKTRFTSEDNSTVNLQNNYHVEVQKNAKPHPKEKSTLHQLERKTMKCSKSQPFPNYHSLGGAGRVKHPDVVVKPHTVVVKLPAVVVKPPAVVVKPPDVVVKPPAVVVKPPDVVVKPEPVKMLAPDFGSKGSATPRPATGCFRCKLCGITTIGNVDLKMHLQGAEHKKKLSQAVQKRRSEGVQNS